MCAKEDIEHIVVLKVFNSLYEYSGGLEISQPEADLERAANMFVQAEIYQEEGDKLQEEAEGYVLEAQKYGPDMLTLNEKIASLKPEAAMWEWLPEWFPVGARDEMGAAEVRG